MCPTPTRSVSEALRSQNQIAPTRATFFHNAERRATISTLRRRPRSFAVARMSLVSFLVSCMLIGGCTSLSEYLQNGLKVGPNYGRPPAPVAQDWIDAADKRVRSDPHD